MKVADICLGAAADTRARFCLAGAFAMSLMMTACTTDTAPTEAYSGDAEHGRQLAQDLCSGCHAIEAIGASPHAEAPPFRNMLAGYGPEQLADELRHTGHISYLKMPQFFFGEHGPADLVAYIETISIDPDAT